MLPLLVAVILSPAADAAPEARPREVPVAVYTKKEASVEDLRVEEIEVKEDGKKKTVLGLERDQRRVDVALILDSGETMGNDYRSSLVAAAMAFWRALPPEARVSVWTCGGRPSKVVDFGVGPEAAEPILQEVATGGPIFALDTMIDAARDLQKARAKRRVLVIVTDSQIQANRTLIQRTFRTIARTRVTPMVILVQAGVSVGQEWDTETIFEQMTDGYGGSYELVLTPQASHKMLARAAADLSSQYLVRYESEAEKPGRPEVKVKRKGLRVRVGLSQIVPQTRRSAGPPAP
jgi:hypothetical protein